MEYVAFNNHIKMLILGLGSWYLRGQECINTIAAVIEMGTG